MSVNRINPDTGELEVLAELNKRFVGTKQEWEYCENKTEYEIVHITDDETGDIATYMNNQLELSDIETINAKNLTAEYDGFIWVQVARRSAINVGVSINGTNFILHGSGSGSTEQNFVTMFPVRKGDVCAAIGTNTTISWAQYYKKRGYSKREV